MLTVDQRICATSVRAILGHQDIDAFEMLCEFGEGDRVDVDGPWDVALVRTERLGITRDFDDSVTAV